MKTIKLFLVIVTTLFLAATSLAQNKSNTTFEVGNKSFLLNGKPFVIKAAEIHYARIPREYWDHRIKMCKALGMNTLCMYIFWNFHEMQPGVFDFSGNKDIAEFCRIAQQNEMYVIVRPGPYVCAEWEMGGLPWWLLNYDDIKLRTLDPNYMKHVKNFMQKVGEQLSPILITNGGNIIMVQVENEYGSYGTDKPYISAIRDIVKESGFNGIPLFQCDWSSNFTNNALDDLLWTVNFGTGANIDDQFAKLKTLRPNSPLMCSEFWSGWFDHWGRPHETRPANVMVDGIREMMDKNISFSLYMTIGGTTFGHWGGANNPAYSAMCSSYDYDAPISEAGHVTPKYTMLRNLLYNKYLTPAESKSNTKIPKPYPVIEIDKIKLDEISPIFLNLPTPTHCSNIMPMEKFNQGWGSIIYRHIMECDYPAGTTINIDELHDYAIIYINGKQIAQLDRRKAQYTATLPKLKAGETIDIFVEALGRVNFDKSIHDRKGITNKVSLIHPTTKSETILNDWDVYCIPTDYNFAINRNYQKGNITTMPAYYKGTFKLSKTGDTFLDFSTWGKGLVWVNGHALGRIWEIGPQQTLYMPGCWLREGDNEIIVLDIVGPQNSIVEGRKTPILDMLRVSVPPTHRKEGEKISLVDVKPIAEGEFVLQTEPQTVNFAPTKAQYLCLETLSNHVGNNITSIAEIDLIDTDGNIINREKWSIRYADSEETRSGDHNASLVYDLQESTYWQTVDNASHPHQLVINLGKIENVKALRIIPRPEAGNPGMPKGYKIYLSEKDFKY